MSTHRQTVEAIDLVRRRVPWSMSRIAFAVSAFVAVGACALPSPAVADAPSPVSCYFLVPQFAGFPKADAGGKYAFDLLVASPQKNELSERTAVSYHANVGTPSAANALSGTVTLQRTSMSGGVSHRQTHGPVLYIWLVKQFLVPESATGGYANGWSCDVRVLPPATPAPPVQAPFDPEGAGGGGARVTPRPGHLPE